MPVSFARLRIAGFKSFAEPVSIEILPGLTGIVGPNGCGKSNVVEALRWVMGESSARSLRGGEMDDLIFAGTAARPARNLAEVILTLEGAAGLAPSDDGDELQISRQIERGAGSTYRINGRDARARDVQTLFADLSSGARSAALISQGRVAAIVNARPEERRSILEEAAGITGLHGRRQEAEIKLRAAEANLSRTDDLRSQLDGQVRALGVQAAQAGRYRTVVAELREAETALPALLHERARRAVVLTGEARSAAQAALADAQQRASEAGEAEAGAEQALPGQRDAEAAARSLLERRRIEAEGAAREDERARRDAEQVQARLTQAQEDHDAAAVRHADAQDAQARLLDEEADLQAAAAALPERRRAHEARISQLRDRLQVAEQLACADADASTSAAMRQAEHARDQDAASGRLRRAEALLLQVAAEHEQREAALPDPILVQAEEHDRSQAADALARSERALDLASAAHVEAVRALDIARIEAGDATRRKDAAALAVQQADLRAARLDAEQAELQRRLDAAAAGVVPEAERQAAMAIVREAEAELAEAAARLDAAELTRRQAAVHRLEAGARKADASRHRQQVEAALSQADRAHCHAVTQHDALAREHAAAADALVPAGMVEAGHQGRADAEARLAAARDVLVQAEAALDAAQTVADDAAMRFAAARDAQGQLAAEAEGLSEALAGQEAPSGSWRILADALEVPDGLENALAACLSDALDAAHPDDAADAPRSWQALPPLEPGELPGGAVPLEALVRAPGALARAFSHAGLIEDHRQGDALQASLRPGQCLVSRDGALWRWDGYRVAPGQPDAVAGRLRQRIRLRDTSVALEAAKAVVAAVQDEAARSTELRDAVTVRARQARNARNEAEHLLARAREEERQVVGRDVAARARLDMLTPQRDHTLSARVEAEAALAAARAARASLPSSNEVAAAHEEAKRRDDEALDAEIEAHVRRQRAEAALQVLRDAVTALTGRHVEAQTAVDALAPLLTRAVDDAAAAAAALAEAATVLAALPSDGGPTDPDLASQRAAAAEVDEAVARAARRAARLQLDACVAACDRTAAALLEGRSRLDALRSRLDDAEEEREAAQDAVRALAASAAGLPDPVPAADVARRSAQALDAVRQEERDAVKCGQAMAAEQAALDARRVPVAVALADWQARLRAAEAVLTAAGARLAAARGEQVVAAAGPAEAAKRAQVLTDAVLAAQAVHDAAQEALQQALSWVRRAQTERRAAEASLTAAREAALRAEGREMQAQAVLSQLAADATHPPAVAPADLSDAAEAGLRRRIARLVRERDEIGPVNLRAELELHDAEERCAAIGRERDEMEDAIARLRGQIGHLNRVGRKRLMAVFEQMDRQFRTLFTRMFDGGRAHLGLVGLDDPLEAGIEIYAQPPGKKLATLSLLSGGEQALTALSLVFAVFRCSPAPVCVLDEVDAPLDDANVDRFCTLLADMAQEAGTRFLVVTHHQLTMASMDRLYGVTMQERGVSRVLSVDLARAAAMVG